LCLEQLGQRRGVARIREADESELRRIDPQSGEVLESLEMPAGMGVSGRESDVAEQFFCGGGKKSRTVTGAAVLITPTSNSTLRTCRITS